MKFGVLSHKIKDISIKHLLADIEFSLKHPTDKKSKTICIAKITNFLKNFHEK